LSRGADVHAETNYGRERYRTRNGPDDTVVSLHDLGLAQHDENYGPLCVAHGQRFVVLVENQDFLLEQRTHGVCLSESSSTSYE
jgi:hypothetical protein